MNYRCSTCGGICGQNELEYVDDDLNEPTCPRCGSYKVDVDDREPDDNADAAFRYVEISALRGQL